MINDSGVMSRCFWGRMILIFCILSIIVSGAAVAVRSVSSKVTAADNGRLSFRMVSVSSNDTLWNIAKENYSEQWGSLSDYLEEIMRCNALTSETITAGHSLIVPIYLPAEADEP